MSIAPSRYHAHTLELPRLVDGRVQARKGQYLFVGCEVLIVAKFCEEGGSRLPGDAAYRVKDGNSSWFTDLQSFTSMPVIAAPLFFK